MINNSYMQKLINLGLNGLQLQLAMQLPGTALTNDAILALLDTMITKKQINPAIAVNKLAMLVAKLEYQNKFNKSDNGILDELLKSVIEQE